jgi:cell division protein FtsN
MTLIKQAGGTFFGFITGMVLGLIVAVVVAIFVTQVPTPFSSKNQPRTSAQDAQESEKNKDWNPNSVLQPKAPAPAPTPDPASAPAIATVPAQPVVIAPTSSAAPVYTTPDTAADTSSADAAKVTPPPRPAVLADPIGDLAKAKSGLNTAAKPATSNDANDPFDYVVQAGAYRSNTEADSQKAKLALLGLDARVSERDQAGRVVYRVRLGPFSDKGAAERVRAQLESNGIDNTLVRVQR